MHLPGVSHGRQLVNRVMDISSVIDRKVAVNRLNVTQGPAASQEEFIRKNAVPLRK